MRSTYIVRWPGPLPELITLLEQTFTVIDPSLLAVIAAVTVQEISKVNMSQVECNDFLKRVYLCVIPLSSAVTPPSPVLGHSEMTSKATCKWLRV